MIDAFNTSGGSPPPMSRAEAMNILSRLSRTFSIEVPLLRWHERPVRGVSRSWRDRRSMITASALSERGPVNTLLHEFAHVLNASRAFTSRTAAGSDPVALAFYIQRFPKSGSGHGPDYYGALLDVIRAHQGDTRLYAWETEYIRLQEWAVRDGLVPSVVRTGLMTDRELAARLRINVSA